MYHIAIEGRKQGPLNEAEVREKIARGELKPTDLCWREGWQEWRRVDAVFAAQAEDAPPPLPLHATGAADLTGAPKTCGLAKVSLAFGICTFVLFPLCFLFMIPAIVCGHVAQSRIRQARGALVGGGMALAGLIMGYMGVAIVPVGGLVAAMAIPAFQKVRESSVGKMMDNDARLIASAAQQHFMETDATSVPFTYDQTTGIVDGPLATYVQRISAGYSEVPSQLTAEGDFRLKHRRLRRAHIYDKDGRLVGMDPPARGGR
jgi:hypothetical protein